MNAPAHPILNNYPTAMLTRRHLVTLMGAGGLSFAMAGCSMLTPEYSAYVREEQGEQGNPRGSYQDLAEALWTLQQDAGAENLSLSLYNYADQKTFVFTPEYRGYEASTVKVPLALSAMRQAFARSRVLSEDLRKAVKASIGFSDNDATAVVFGSLADTDENRAGEVNTTYNRLGINQTRADAGWGANLTGTEDHLKISRAVYEGVDWIGSEDMQILREAMTASDPASQGWGVGVLGKLQGAGADSTDLEAAQKILCKNGWLPNDLGKWYINSDGVVLYRDKTFALSVMVFGFKAQEEGQHLASKAVEVVMRHLAE